MPQLQNLVLTDRETTPVAHTFTPGDIVDGWANVIESDGVPIGNRKVSIKLTELTTGRFQTVLKFAFPVVQVQTVNGVSNPVVVRTNYAELKFVFDKTSNEQERKNVVGMVQSSLDASKPLTNDVVVKLQNVF